MVAKLKELFVKALAALKATPRDLVLAGVAAASGFLAGKALPKTAVEVKALVVGLSYAVLRGVVAFLATKLKARTSA